MIRAVESTVTVRCVRDTRPAVDGMRTICGEERVFHGGSVDDALSTLRQEGWTHTGAGAAFCPVHPYGRIEGNAA